MEDLPIKAIVIGVSVFVTKAVLSALILYFNTARGVSDIVQKRADIAITYDSIVNEDKFEDNLTGVQVRSLITKYVGNSNVRINIVEIEGMTPEDYKKKDVNNEDINYKNVNNNSNWVKTQNGAKIIKESKLDIINPIWNCKVDKVKNTDTITLNIRLDVEKQGEI